ncbi:ABC transporter ATP-binding protein [Rubinisphaera italica]|uniref:Lipoprotein-releasing system ATP-binding protein LolD n=1 Tax=Rubinisphaera italica TaxID=2527969 RepID=A0A5C5XQD4_9PLAN|nr:ABC transporter ATP-binding protein [Rubinisphaera italica]TWT63982.1 Lipoprotein-releasing system ATP-binding protein LolD [Rubinisphaera italica]HBN76466.1 ATP-binding protein [Planctomycetaceae bacterium]
MNDESLKNEPSAKLIVRKLFKSYESAGRAVSILRDLDFTLETGAAASIIGPSGSGKSTLLYLISALDRPDAGSIELLGRDMIASSEKDQTSFRNAHIGFVFQDHNLLPQLNVLENVLLPCLAGNGVDPEKEKFAIKLLKRVGLKDRVTHRPAQLSGGERQRVAVCRALINQPELILADEPTGNLDPQTATVIGDLLLEISREQGAMLLCVTHSLELAYRFPVCYQLEEGRLVVVDRSAETATT